MSEKCIRPDDRKFFSVLRNCAKFSFPCKEKSSNVIACMIWQGEALSCEQKCELRAPVPMKYRTKAAVRLVLPEAFSADLEISLYAYVISLLLSKSVKGEMGFNFGASWDRSRGY